MIKDSIQSNRQKTKATNIEDKLDKNAIAGP